MILCALKDPLVHMMDTSANPSVSNRVVNTVSMLGMWLDHFKWYVFNEEEDIFLSVCAQLRRLSNTESFFSPPPQEKMRCVLASPPPRFPLLLSFW